MTDEELKDLIDVLRNLPNETEWVEFKGDNYNPHDIGEYISALANSACLHDKEAGYLVFGIEDASHTIKGTSFRPRQTKKGNEELENWLTLLLNPRVDFVIHECKYNGNQVVLFQIDPAHHIPIKFNGEAFIRVGSYKRKLKDFPEKERKIWLKSHIEDWSSGICEGALLQDLDPAAIQKARDNFKKKYPAQSSAIDSWDDIVFLNKAKITIQGKITRTAIILLGRNESEHFLNPSVARISWFLRDESNREKDYEHFGPPFILNIDAIYNKIRNLTYRYLPDNTLFPIEILQYEPYVIREALNNCIAHQDYELRGRINVVERPEELLFTNLGSFLPGTVERVIEEDAPPEFYRNAFLANAMVNLNLIDTQGGGIKKMFLFQMHRYFPLPDYDLSQTDKVLVRITGKIIDENYTRLLTKRADLGMKTVILLDRIQKHESISKNDAVVLKRQRLIEGRYPALYIAAPVADITNKKAQYIKNRPFDDAHFKKMILDYIKRFGYASRVDIDNLLMDKLSDVLSEKQKRNKIRNLITALSTRDKSIKNTGSDKRPRWILTPAKG